MSKGHYICDICHKYIRTHRKGKLTNEKIVNHKEKIYSTGRSSYQVYYTKAHKKCLIEKGGV